MKKYIFLFVVATMFGFASMAQDYVDEQGLYFNKVGDVVNVGSNAESLIGDIVIPSQVTIEGTVYPVTFIAEYGFANFRELTSVTIPESIVSIKPNAFQNCESLTSITLPKSVTGVGSGAFWRCDNLTEVIIKNGNVDVSNASLYFTKDSVVYHVLNNNTVNFSSYGYYDEDGDFYYQSDVKIPATVTAGNTFIVAGIEYDAFYRERNLTSIVIEPTFFVFDYDIYFTKDGIRYHVIDYRTVEVVRNGYYDYGWINTDYSGDVIIPANVTAGNTFMVEGIEKTAFYNDADLTSITLPETIIYIDDDTFDGCTNLTEITCLGTMPPAATNSFTNYDAHLYYPCESRDLYENDDCWRLFQNAECFGAETVELPTDEVFVEPDKNEVLFSMPFNESADSYVLTIKNNGEVFCIVTFNAQGELSNEEYSATKSYDLKAGVSGFQFVVTGLSIFSNYEYSFKVIDKKKVVLKEYAGSFTTLNEDGTSGNGEGSGEREGDTGNQEEQGGEEDQTAVSELSNDIVITVENNQILINGIAPTFVTLVSGQKIINVNLQSCVYFVQIAGKMVGISIQ